MWFPNCFLALKVLYERVSTFEEFFRELSSLFVTRFTAFISDQYNPCCMLYATFSFRHADYIVVNNSKIICNNSKKKSFIHCDLPGRLWNTTSYRLYTRHLPRNLYSEQTCFLWWCSWWLEGWTTEINSYGWYFCCSEVACNWRECNLEYVNIFKHDPI